MTQLNWAETTHPRISGRNDPPGNWAGCRYNVQCVRVFSCVSEIFKYSINYCHQSHNPYMVLIIFGYISVPWVSLRGGAGAFLFLLRPYPHLYFAILYTIKIMRKTYNIPSILALFRPPGAKEVKKPVTSKQF